MADVLESTYGVPVEFRVGGVDIFKAVTAFGALTKRAKLFASLFQHVDFLTRGAIVAMTPEGIRHGTPLKFPSIAARITASTFSPSIRGNLETRVLSGDPLYNDFDISLRDVADAGWELGADESLIKREVAEDLNKLIKEAQAEGLEVSNFRKVTAKITAATDPVTRRLNDAARFFETGLFEGVYRESQAFAIEHVIIPRIRRSNPGWTKEQIAGGAAREVNKQFSTLPVWQSVLKQPAVRSVARAFFFSFNESESLIRQAGSVLKGPNAAYWREFSLSTFYTLAIAANVINLISEGEPLPEDRYVPVKFGSPYSPMPGGIAYSDKFLSPRLPWNGRGGQPIYLDLMGQMDTWLRWILDPAGALTSRVNVFPRAVMNQIQGKDFWGRELTDLPDRARQAMVDLFAPIGAGNLIEVARTQFPPIREIIPEQEGRVGNIGSLIQATGLNVRAIKTRDMLDNFAREANLVKANGAPVKTWSDLEPNQRRDLEKNKTLQRELGLRGDAAVERNYPGAKGFAELDKLDQERVVRGEALVGELTTELLNKDRTEAFGLARNFRDEVSRLKRDIASRKSQVNRDFKLFEDTGELPEDPNNRAIVEYYNIFEKAKRPSGVIDWEKVNELEAGLREKWTPEQTAFVERNTGITEWGPLMEEFVQAGRILSESGWYDVPARGRKLFRFEHPEVEEVLTGKFYNQKPIEGEAERISLTWDDVYRQLGDAKEALDLLTDKNLNALPPLEGFSQEEWDELSPDEKKRIMLDFNLAGTYRENPGFFEADKKRDAWRRGFGENLIPLYLQREAIARNTNHGSAEVIVFMHDNPDLLNAGIKLDQWEGADDPNIPRLRIIAKWREVDELYDAVDKDDADAVDAFKAAHKEWNDDNRRKDAFGWDRDIDLKIVEAHVKQGNLADEFSSNSAEVMLARFDDTSGLEKFRTDPANAEEGFALQPIDPKDVPKWRIDAANRENDAQYDAIKFDDNSKQRTERDAFLDENPGYARDRRERQFYEIGLELDDDRINLLKPFADYKLLPTKGFRGERFLKEHPDLYKLLLDEKAMKGNAITAIDFNRIPNVKFDDLSEKWETQLDQYDAIPDKYRTLTDRSVAEASIKRDRGRLFQREFGFEEAFYRREGYGIQLDRGGLDLIRNHVTYNLFESKGMEQELFLKTHTKYWNAVGAIINPDAPRAWHSDLRDKPVESLRISVRFQRDFDQYASYSERGTRFFESDPDRREVLRKQFLLGNPKFARGRRERQAWDLGVRAKLVDNFADYALIIEAGKPERNELWYADDRYLRDNPNFYNEVWIQLLGRDARDFSKIPSNRFEDSFNQIYGPIKGFEGDTKAAKESQSEARAKRKQFRRDNPWFDEEGARVGFWKALEEQKAGRGRRGRDVTRGLV